MNKRLFVGNLQWSMDDIALKHFFEVAGHVVNANVIIDRNTGRSRGFGFVEMETEDEAQKALELNGKYVGGRQIRVNEAEAEKGADPSTKIINDFIASDVAIGEQIEILYGEKKFVLSREV